MRPVKLIKYVGITLSLVFITGCGEKDLSDLEQFVAETKASYNPAIEPPPTIPNFPTFSYASEDLREPFTANESGFVDDDNINDADDNGIAPEKYRRKEELEQYPLDALRMVGTLDQVEDTIVWGLIKAPDGTIHRVKTGNYMGLNYGKILKVNDESIELLEIISKPTGGWEERDASVAINGLEQ